jgi:hypothetical protein
MRQTVIMPRSGVIAVLFALLLAAPLAAHHSTAEFDLKHPATVSGTVTRFEWSNPHVHIYLDAIGQDGSVEHWTIDIDSPNALSRTNWTKQSLEPGDKITCSGARAKDGSPHMRCTEVMLANGAVLHSA